MFDIIKNNIKLEQLLEIDGYILTRVGKNYKTKCMFHQDSNPSFHIRTEKNTFKCFGCGESGDVLTFIEVRTRKSEDYGSPKESITKRKQDQLSKVALEFINKNNVHHMKSRFDVVAVYLLPQKEQVELIKNAFELTIH